MDQFAYRFSFGTSAFLLGAALAAWISRFPLLHP